MKYRDCDQVSGDLFDSQADAEIEFQEPVKLPYSLVEVLLDQVSATYRPGYSFASVLELVLDSHPLTTQERYGFKRFLGRFFGRRSGTRQGEVRKLEAATDFPRGQEL